MSNIQPIQHNYISPLSLFLPVYLFKAIKSWILELCHPSVSRGFSPGCYQKSQCSTCRPADGEGTKGSAVLGTKNGQYSSIAAPITLYVLNRGLFHMTLSQAWLKRPLGTGVNVCTVCALCCAEHTVDAALLSSSCWKGNGGAGTFWSIGKGLVTGSLSLRTDVRKRGKKKLGTHFW